MSEIFGGREDKHRTKALVSLCQVVVTLHSGWGMLQPYPFRLTQLPYRRACFCRYDEKKASHLV